MTRVDPLVTVPMELSDGRVKARTAAGTGTAAAAGVDAPEADMTDDPTVALMRVARKRAADAAVRAAEAVESAADVHERAAAEHERDQ